MPYLLKYYNGLEMELNREQAERLQVLLQKRGMEPQFKIIKTKRSKKNGGSIWTKKYLPAKGTSNYQGNLYNHSREAMREYFAGKSVNEIADIFGVSNKAVYKWIKRNWLWRNHERD